MHGTPLLPTKGQHHSGGIDEGDESSETELDYRQLQLQQKQRELKAEQDKQRQQVRDYIGGPQKKAPVFTSQNTQEAHLNPLDQQAPALPPKIPQIQAFAPTEDNVSGALSHQFAGGNGAGRGVDFSGANMTNGGGGGGSGDGANQGDRKSIGEMACDEGPGLCAYLITFMSILLVFVTIPFSLCFAVKVVQEYERVVIFRLGRLLSGGARGPGIFFIVPCVDSYQKVDMRTLTFDVPPQEILTKDSVTVHVDAIMYYKVSNAICAISNVDDYGQSTRLLAATTLRNVLGTKNLGDILSEREVIANMMQSTLDEATDPWGVKVERVEVKDVRLPQQLQRAMAAEAEAAREARAKVIAAEGEHLASESLALAAEIISRNPAALQLRYLQTLNNISAEKNSTIVFPIPIDIISHLLGGKMLAGPPGSAGSHSPLQTLVH